MRRWKRLISALWRISSDPRLANTPELREISLEGETVTLDASETWHGRFLLDSQMNLTKIPADDPLPVPVDQPGRLGARRVSRRSSHTSHRLDTTPHTNGAQRT